MLRPLLFNRSVWVEEEGEEDRDEEEGKEEEDMENDRTYSFMDWEEEHSLTG